MCVLLLTVLSFIFIYFTFFALPLINFDILSGVDIASYSGHVGGGKSALFPPPTWPGYEARVDTK